jgi:hypothetical protein
MTTSPETFNSFWAYCSANGRAIPRDWQRLYEMLAEKKRKPSGGWGPPLPLLLAAWHRTTPSEKQSRFKEHIQWAADHIQLDEVEPYLRALSEGQWFHVAEL